MARHKQFAFKRTGGPGDAIKQREMEKRQREYFEKLEESKR